VTNPTFPADLAPEQDSKYYGVDHEDVALRTKVDGGYVVSRAKHTRRPRRTFSTGFTSIGEAQRQTLVDFYEAVKGGSVIFDWTDPITGDTIAVRFAEGGLPFKYVGMGPTKLWDVQFKLEEA
jgi:hypothetical protein